MNYLGLCKRLRQEAGYSGSGPASVEGQAGEAQRIVDWVRDAWTDIQGMYDDWRFMRATFSHSFAADEYTVNLLTDFKTVKAGSVVITRPDGNRYQPVEITGDEMLLMRRMKQDIAGLPQYFSIEDGVLTLYPSTSEAISIEGDYFKSPTILTANTDVPSLPEAYHMLIVWHALTQLGGFDESSNVYLRALQKHEELLARTCATERPRVKPARALA